MKNIDERIKEIDAELARLEQEETNIEEKPERELLDKTEEAIENIRESVSELIEIEDIKANLELNPEHYNNRNLNIVSWFNYLKRHKPETSEYEEAKDLVISIGKKHPILAEWCNNLIEKPLAEPPIYMYNAELNIDKTNEFIITEGVKIIVDRDKAKEIVDTKWVIGTKEYNELKFEYKIIVNEKEYKCLYHIVNYIPKCEYPEDCPYMVSLTDWETADNGERLLRFNILEIDLQRK